MIICTSPAISAWISTRGSLSPRKALSEAIIWSASGDGQFDYFNSRWTEITGNELPKTADDWRAVVHLDESEMAFGKWAECFRDGKPFESEYRLKQADGSWKKLKDPADKGGDDNVYYEDKWAMLWPTNEATAKIGRAHV